MKKTYLTLFVLLHSFLVNAQVTTTSVWKWIRGDSVLNSYGRYGTKGVTHPDNSPYSRNGGRSWTDAGGNFWLFGGLGPVASGNNKLNDLWRFMPASSQWTWLSGDSIPGQTGIYGVPGMAAPGNKPGGRTRSVNWIDASGNLWLYGGQGNAAATGTGQRYLSDLWKYNPVSGQWTWVSGDSVVDVVATYGTRGVAGRNNSPGGRNNAACWKDASGRFWLFGGFGFGSSATGVGQLNDLWLYDPATNEWTWVSGDTIVNQPGIFGMQGTPSANNHPGCRELTMTWTDASGRFWMFGGTGYHAGTGGTRLLNELWRYDPSTAQWTWMNGDSTGNQLSVYGTKGIAASGNAPGGRQGGPGWSDAAGNLWISGGLGYGNSGASGRLSDIWKYTPATNMWTWMSGDSSTDEISNYGINGVADTANTPGARSGHVAWIDGTGDVYLFGGVGLKMGSSGFENDLWKLEPRTSSGVSVHGQVPQDIFAYPNPAKERLNLVWKPAGKIQWRIIDNMGKVLEESAWIRIHSDRLFIDVRKLPAGTFYLQIEEEGSERRQFRFLKL